MKRVLSLVFSLVMAVSIITGMDVSVFAADTEVESYNIYKADRYAEAFDDIFVGTGSSSYARNFYNELVNDKLLMGEIVAWESLHMIASPSYSLDSGMITKYDYFKTVLFDLLISKSEDTIATKAQDNFEYLFDQVKNSKNSFIVSTAKKITSTDEGLTIVKLKETKLTDFYKTTILNSTRFADSVAVASDVMQILEWCDNVYDAIELTSNYCALTDVYDGTKEVLQYIADDTRNNEDVRLAAANCIACLGDSYTEIVNAMCIGSFSLFIDVGTAFIDTAWKTLVATIPGVNVAMFALQGSRLIVNLLMSQDSKTKAYYQIESNVICEDAIIRAMSGLKESYLNNKTEENAIIYMRAVEMYKDDILLGFDYSIDLLEVLVEANLSVIIGTYNKGINLINDLYSYKSQKLNNFIKLEDAINTVYINTYIPDYTTVLNEYNNQETIEVESISLELIDEINVGDTGYIGNYIDVIKYPANANDLFIEKFVSLNEDVIKLNEYYFIEVVGVGECTIICNQGTEFETAITVTVGDIVEEDANDYIADIYCDWTEELIDDVWESCLTLRNYTCEAQYIVLPQTVEYGVVERIGDYAISCYNAKTIKLPSTIKYIDEYAFDCSNLMCIDIPAQTKRIADRAFYYCTNLISFTVDEDNINYSSVDGVLFDKNKNILIQYPAKKSNTEYIIPNTVVSINNDAFDGCNSLASITIPDSVVSIGEYAFYGCDSLASLTIGNNVMSIGDYAFGWCTGLTSITIPDSVTNIGNRALGYYYDYGYKKIDGFTIYGTKGSTAETYANNNGFEFVGIEAECTHTSFDWIIDVESTCTKDGSRHKECTLCGEITETEALPATGHNYEEEWTIDVIATCTEEGIKSHHCIICDEKTEITVISITGHTVVKDVAIPATCNTSGKTEGSHCSVCGEVIKAQTTVATKGHTSSSWITDKKATVNSTGKKHKECEVCEEILETATIPQLKCAKPVLKKVYNANSYVKITWGTVKGADLYRVYRKTGTGDYEYIGSTTNTYFNDKEAGAGKTCRYIIKAKNEAGNSDASASISIEHIDEPTLKSIENSAYGVLIKWDKVTGAQKYNIYRKVSGGEYEYIGATTNAYYTDKTAKSGTKYYYAIRGKRDDSVSSQSASLSKLYLADPTLKTPSSTTSGVKLSWSKVNGAEGYIIYRKSGSGSYIKLKTEKGVSNLTYRDTSAKKGKTYTYMVKAYYSKTFGASSNTERITHKY